LAVKGLPSLTLNEYQDSINYKPDDALVFLAGVDEQWLKEYQNRIKQRERASAIYHSSQPKSVWSRISELTRIVAIGIFLALFICFIFLLLY
jgi:multidrug efflux pump subunit AcrB